MLLQADQLGRMDEGRLHSLQHRVADENGAHRLAYR
jgi:hypothetical protein